ncbi:MAG: Fur family transcriptional regulator [Acidobacteriota bacterium]|nr:transcriptional repressor [Acidobacteriota bacterium]OQB59182.1 MAG: Ferric uptake regulation protein [Candidatus Aminicenantes bacterium ADurb.Bin147]HNQ81205.1 Fur family transcriptional regulator [Candidatus Aminicenantes bacterium]MDD8010096.1 Fur family transcriptional regulator [Acidobacteriota bacterium]MDD8028740.1 Fur family transcriptional regulator [Acidobacteriota bacterium]
MNSIPAIKSALKASGRRITSKREVILDLLRKIPGHPDAETLFLEAKKIDPRIGLSTVYRTLALLKKEGFIEEHRLGQSHGHFEASRRAAHVHFSCLACGQVIECENPLVNRLKTEIKRTLNADLKEFHVYAGGFCRSCRPTGGRP